MAMLYPTVDAQGVKVLPYQAPCNVTIAGDHGVWPACTWTLEASKIDYYTSTFACQNVPTTALVSYTVTPTLIPASNNPTFSVKLWGSDEADLETAIDKMSRQNAVWNTLSHSVRQTLPENIDLPYNIDDLDLLFGALDLSNLVKTLTPTFIFNTESPFGGAATYAVMIDRDPRYTQPDHCSETLITVSFT